MITQERLKELLHYDPDTGSFTRKIRRGPQAPTGPITNQIHPRGYIYIQLDGNKYQAHRLAWFYIHGELPTQLDHIDNDGTNNQISNLRPATPQQNQFNKRRSSKHATPKGVHYDPERNKWRACATLNRKHYYLGRYDTIREAADAYQAFTRNHHGEFRNDPT